MEKIQDLLTKVLLIKNRYDTIEKHTGDNFNIFKIMRLEQDEVYTHSAIISELLNVKGSHNLGNVFLKVFIDCFNNNFSELNNPLLIQDWQNSKSFIEVPIGTINNDATEGGRIDILVKSDNKRIIFENKINALDQKNQLFRYHNYALQKGQEFWLIYLTKFPQNPEPFTTNNDASVISKTINLTYGDFIKDWIEKCIPLAFDKPLLRETLRQYLATVKRITNQSTNKEMEQELISLLTSNGNNVISAMTIFNSLEQVKRNLLLKFAKTLEVRVKHLYPNSEIIISENFGKKWHGMDFKIKGISKEYLRLSFLADMKEFYLEVFNENNGSSSNKKDIKNIEYYKKYLHSLENGGNKIENVSNAWWGDWVCRYRQLDNFFNDKRSWGLIADNDASMFTEDVASTIIIILNAIDKKASKLSGEIVS